MRRPPGEARRRLLDATLRLYAAHGVGGTSLRMIADELGVTKAAVYHQFATKEEIALAVVQPAIDALAAVADAAEAAPTRAARRETALTGVVELMVTDRERAAVLSGDPAMAALIGGHAGLATQARRLSAAILGASAGDPESRVAATLLAGGMATAGRDPGLADLTDDELRTHLLTLARRLLRMRAPHA
ncbi:TetR/AcrR family transcriptional regulator [Catenuloplanes atrovinosus]|uniref:AcrR family transcriptional regulator n=1 Tax=Catenuloplanes atrovinosus TaxID=137266 RepID=A0AAE4C8W0_9ACTN|nr:helix-turn-helix domain-containing protein [Catenuloplanes atrovinosus]MDR7275037.1 AcrR family transcriptional regulator [Catenuloplanes atrovinosus]